MHPHLQRALDLMHSTTGRLSGDQWLRHAEGKWSPAEIVEHLAQAFGSTVTLLDKHLQGGCPSLKPRTLKHRLLDLLVIQIGHFPTGAEAPEFTLPRGAPPEAAVHLFRENISAMDSALSRCQQLFGPRTRIASHFVFGPLTADQWRKFHWVHTRHHMRQIARIKQHV